MSIINVTINVRLEGPTEAAVQEAARQMGVRVSTIKPRGNCVHLYGAVAVPVAPAQRVTVSRVTPPALPHR